MFKNKIFVTFRRAKSLKDKLVRAKLPSIDEDLMEKGTLDAMAEKVARFAV